MVLHNDQKSRWGQSCRLASGMFSVLPLSKNIVLKARTEVLGFLEALIPPKRPGITQHYARDEFTNFLSCLVVERNSIIEKPVEIHYWNSLLHPTVLPHLDNYCWTRSRHSTCMYSVHGSVNSSGQNLIVTPKSRFALVGYWEQSKSSTVHRLRAQQCCADV